MQRRRKSKLKNCKKNNYDKKNEKILLKTRKNEEDNDKENNEEKNIINKFEKDIKAYKNNHKFTLGFQPNY